MYRLLSILTGCMLAVHSISVFLTDREEMKHTVSYLHGMYYILYFDFAINH